MTAASISVSDLVVEFGTPAGPVRPIDQMTMHVEPGSLALLNGPSGSGKTTLLSVLSGMLAPTRGSVIVDDVQVVGLTGRELEDFRRTSIGIVFQGFNLLPALTAAENVAAPLLAAGARRRDALDRARERLAEVGLADRADHRPLALSGGQQQRVAIARGLIGDAQVVLADEPTANLDPASAEAVIDLLRRLCRSGRTVLVSTHDQRLLPLAEQVIDLVPGHDEAAAGGSPIDLPSGVVLFEQGDPSDVVYWIEAGAVEVVIDGTVVATVDSGSYVGELGPLLGLTRSATIRAATETILHPLSVAEFRTRQMGSV